MIPAFQHGDRYCKTRPRPSRPTRHGVFGANHAVGSLAPLIPGHVGCIVIRPGGSRQLARVVPDPLAE
jgi:hypothetical protein